VNYDQAALPKNKYNVNTGAYPKGARARVDTSYVENGVIINKTLTEKLTHEGFDIHPYCECLS
jgi:hypothetical protein